MVVVVLPLAEFVAEDLGVVDQDAVEELVELLGIDAVGAALPCRSGAASGFEVDVPDGVFGDVLRGVVHVVSHRSPTMRRDVVGGHHTKFTPALNRPIPG
jgi:hypothetical protein